MQRRFLFEFLFAFALKIVNSTEPCCEVLTVNSLGETSKFYPEVLGTYKKLNHHRRKIIYQHVSNFGSYIYISKSPRGRVFLGNSFCILLSIGTLFCRPIMGDWK